MSALATAAAVSTIIAASTGSNCGRIASVELALLSVLESLRCSLVFCHFSQEGAQPATGLASDLVDDGELRLFS